MQLKKALLPFAIAGAMWFLPKSINAINSSCAGKYSDLDSLLRANSSSMISDISSSIKLPADNYISSKTKEIEEKSKLAAVCSNYELDKSSSRIIRPDIAATLSSNPSYFQFNNMIEQLKSERLEHKDPWMPLLLGAGSAALYFAVPNNAENRDLLKVAALAGGAAGVTISFMNNVNNGGNVKKINEFNQAISGYNSKVSEYNTAVILNKDEIDSEKLNLDAFKNSFEPVYADLIALTNMMNEPINDKDIQKLFPLAAEDSNALNKMIETKKPVYVDFNSPTRKKTLDSVSREVKKVKERIEIYRQILQRYGNYPCRDDLKQYQIDEVANELDKSLGLALANSDFSDFDSMMSSRISEISDLEYKRNLRESHYREVQNFVQNYSEEISDTANTANKIANWWYGIRGTDISPCYDLGLLKGFYDMPVNEAKNMFKDNSLNLYKSKLAAKSNLHEQYSVTGDKKLDDNTKAISVYVRELDQYGDLIKSYTMTDTVSYDSSRHEWQRKFPPKIPTPVPTATPVKTKNSSKGTIIINWDNKSE